MRMCQVPCLVCVKNYKHLRRIKNIAALCLAETKGTHGTLEAVYGTGQGNIAGDTAPDSNGSWKEGLFEAVNTGCRLDVFVKGAYSWVEVCLGGDIAMRLLTILYIIVALVSVPCLSR